MLASMPRRGRAVRVGLVLALVLGLVGGLALWRGEDEPPVGPQASAAEPVRTRSLGVTAFGGEVDALTNLHEYAYLQLNAWEADRAAQLKAAHPGLRVLVYKDMSSTRSYAARNGRDDAALPTGVGWAQADREHPEWFLEDTSGARMEWSFPGHWWMDVGNPEYQQRWAESVGRELEAGPWDGVVIDNVLADPAGYAKGRRLAGYPSREAYAAATEDFLQAVAPGLRAKGSLVLGNISDASPATWDRWTRLLSGANHEHAFAWGDGRRYGGDAWLEVVEEVERTQSAERIHTATSSVLSSDRAGLTYVRASWLLAWDGGVSGSAQFVALLDRDDPWNDVVALDLGLPRGARRPAGDGAWQRSFDKGLVLANPTERAVTVALEEPLTDQGGARVTSLVLRPLTGALLRR